jgi:DnaK suppressor protein
MQLTASQIDDLREALETEREGLLARMAGDAAKVVSGVNDTGDLAAEEVSVELMWELEERRSNRLLEIDETLQRMEDGIFGICEHCGEGIPFHRLRAMPSAKRCVRCQQEAERDSGSQHANGSGLWPLRWAM